MAVGWIYRLRKDDLIQELADAGLAVGGTVIQLRQRLVAHVRQHPDEYQDRPADAPGYKEDSDRTRDLEEFHNELAQHLANPHTSTPIRSNLPTAPDTPTVLDRMRKWGCHFDGRDPYDFIERVRELQHAYRFSDDQLLQGFPELLRGEAQLWYRNLEPTITTWNELEDTLRRYYLSPGELRHLDQQIANRRQAASEPIRSYATALMTLIRRRGGFTKERTIDTLYYNMRAELRMHVRREEIDDITRLVQAVEGVEETMKEVREEMSAGRTANPYRAPAPTRGPPRQYTSAVTTAYDRSTHCWRCKEPGHSRFNCRNPTRRFCSHCGKDQVLIRDCPCHQGNAPNAGSA